MMTPGPPWGVVHCVFSVAIGGQEMVILSLASQADRSRFAPRVLCLHSAGELASRFEAEGVPVDVLEAPIGAGSVQTLRAMRAYLRRHRPAILHTHNPSPHQYGALSRVATGVPVLVHTKHGRNQSLSGRGLLLERIANRMTDVVIAVSHDAAEVAHQTEGVPWHRIRIIHNGVAAATAAGTRARGAGWRAVHVARLNQVKDQATLLRAARLVLDANPAFRLDIVGDGELRLDLEHSPHSSASRTPSRSTAITRRAAVPRRRRPVRAVVDQRRDRDHAARSDGGVAAGGGHRCRRQSRGRHRRRHRHAGTGAQSDRAGERHDGGARPIRCAPPGWGWRDASGCASISRSTRWSAVTKRSIATCSATTRRTAGRMTRRWDVTAWRGIIRGFESGIKRRPAFRYWRELEASQWWTAERLAGLQFERLRQLLLHAQSTCPWYTDTWRSGGLDARQVHSPDDFRRWPVIDRDTVRRHRMAMRTTAPGVRLIHKSTGGSSGVPLAFDLDLDSNERRMGAWHRGYGWAGAEPGTRQWYLWGAASGVDGAVARDGSCTGLRSALPPHGGKLLSAQRRARCATSSIQWPAPVPT